MKNSDQKAVVRLGDLDSVVFVQGADGIITLGGIPAGVMDDAVANALKNHVALVYAPKDPVDTAAGDLNLTLTYTDNSVTPEEVKTVVIATVPVTHQYDTTGEYIGSTLNLGIPNLV